MKLESPLKSGILLQRYKRFLADVKLSSSDVITIHCPNTGSMKNCKEPGSKVWYTTSENKKRKYPHTWQFIEVNENDLVGINTSLSNKLVVEAIQSGIINELQNYQQLKTEVPYGDQNSRIDVLLSDGDEDLCFVEVKNVSLGMEAGLGLFPDAVTTRGQKHLEELMLMKKSGARAVLFFCVQHTGIEQVSPADDIDPAYGSLLREAIDKGVEVIAYGTEINLKKSTVTLNKIIPIVL
ncbi:MAG: DNA/RNA nuclease SfsA [Gammaproteobacteria bacterium]|nr:DNA/RNA nuclease SfsA [Gammaproteobacteria bacterium]MDD9960308.1 DNA/RNA nuclease SfsA [Gammaproteobacteria bacterium]